MGHWTGKTGQGKTQLLAGAGGEDKKTILDIYHIKNNQTFKLNF